MNDQHGTTEQPTLPGFIKVWEEIRDEWLSRMKSEADQTAEVMEKIRTAVSLSEATAAYQEWMSRRMERVAEDNRRLQIDAQKVI
ncbi:MAG TPA: hypothetical protein VFJ49_05680, partial [Methyloceanibacter sp.]|nr:hypothetical protein [Methyloceanibacter sp.]